MKCNKCGHLNEDNNSYCNFCGALINTQNISDLLTQKNIDNIKNNLIDESLIKNDVHDEEIKKVKKDKVGNIFIKSINYIKGNMCLLLVITILSLTIGNFIYNILTNINNLSNLNYIDLLLKDLILFGGFLVTIILIYYMALLIINNKLSIKKLTNIISISLYPFIIGIFIIMPLFNLLFDKIAIVFIILFSTYSLSRISININKELNIKDNVRLYFNTICISLVLILSYTFIKII